MTEVVFDRILEQVAPYAYTMQFYFQGEPLLNPLLPTMIARAHAEGLYTIVSTNAQAMTPDLAEQLIEAGLNRIIVSMDGMSEQSYSAYRVGGSLNKCKQALQWLREAKNKKHARTTIELQCLRLKTNEHEWTTFRRAYKALGADRLVFKTAQLYDYEHGHSLMPSSTRNSRYIKGSDGLFHRKPLSRFCFRVWSGCVITTAGIVLPCCYDKAHEYPYGNIMQTPMRELFTNECARKFRKAVLKQLPGICRECWH